MPTGIIALFVVLAALATLAMLVRGVVVMGRGNDPTGSRSQALMRARVKWQAITIVLVVVALLLFQGAS